MIKHILIRVFLCIAALTLVACASLHGSHQCAQTMIKCKSNCQERLNSCKQVCHNDCQSCAVEMKANTICSYNRYRHEQDVQGGIMVRELKSYRDPLQCRKTTCNCLADYNVCKQSCTGRIRKRLQVSPACC